MMLTKSSRVALWANCGNLFSPPQGGGSMNMIDRLSCFRFGGAAGPAVRGFQRRLLNVGSGESHHALR